MPNVQQTLLQFVDSVYRDLSSAINKEYLIETRNETKCKQTKQITIVCAI